MNYASLTNYINNIVAKKFKDAWCAIDSILFEQMTENDLKIDYYSSSDETIIDLGETSWSDDWYYNTKGKGYYRFNYELIYQDSKGKTFKRDKILFVEKGERGDIIPYIAHKEDIIFSLIPNEFINEFLNRREKEYQIELLPYPKFNNVFVPETNPLAKYCFLPLITIKIKNHNEIGDKVFHIISIWDTGDYNECHFGDYRIDVDEVQFDIVEEKLAYKDEIIFPNIQYLEEAYNIISQEFENNLQVYLNLKNEDRDVQMEKGINLILNKIPNFGNSEATFYFEMILSHLLGKYRYEKYRILNSNISNMYDEKDFNEKGKTSFVDNLLLRPIFVQGDQTPPNSIFIGQIYENDYNYFNSSDVFLFFDKEKNRQILITQRT
ncbi:hypothetical protein [Capnocytophaga canimorsus]|uniref:hypothetical protein n=1 Tax=Capnocytophaga canimorsus TaxID=28188 RepID=UPI001562BF0A|nr:hypothetical protein [Capnocytophaga canimorsus]